jgi:hypothetical protein
MKTYGGVQLKGQNILKLHPTPLQRIFLEQMMVIQLVNKFCCYGASE